MGGGIWWRYNIIASRYCGSPTLQKTSVFFGSYFSIALQTKTSLPGRQARSKADNPVLKNPLTWPVEYALFYLKKYCNALEELGLLQNVRIVDQNAPLTNQMKLSGNGAGELQYRAVFLEASRFLNTSVPYLGLLFLNSPPPLFSVNRFSIRLPYRFSVKLENSSQLSAFVIRPGGWGI